MDRLIGQTLGDYRVLEPIGHGSMSRVYRAVQVSLRRPVALKVFQDDLLSTGDLVARMRREAESLAQVQHPNIVPVYGAGSVGDLHYLALKLVEGGTLADLARSGASRRAVFRVARDAARGLAALHARGGVHRDLKPTNVLVEDGAGLLADFGLARLAEDVTITGSGAMIGTPLYMSPEQWRRERATPASDVFSLGLVLYEALTGRHAFLGERADRDGAREALAALYEQGAVPAPIGTGGVPAGVEEAVLRCLRIDPAQRFPDAGEASRALDAVEWPEGPEDSGMRDSGTARTVLSSQEGASRATEQTVLPAGGLRFGRYDLRGELGSGGMGVVYRAWDPSLSREVALKVLRGGQMASEEAILRFGREARSAARLRHPNIVAVHEVGIEEGRHFFTMDLVEGRSLKDVLEGSGLPIEESVRLIVQAARGVDHAHRNGVIHRDLKPANILVEGGRALVGDFGLAREVSAADGATVTGQIMGTPSYMSPEQAGGGVVDSATDVYSLGAVLYQALAGRPPFHGETAFDVVRRVLAEEPQAPRRVNPRAPRDPEVVCLKALEKDPRRRYPTAGEFADDLERWLRREPIHARPASLLYRLGRRVARSPLAAGLLVLLLVVIVASVSTLVSSRARYRRLMAAAHAAAEAKYAFATNDLDAVARHAKEAIRVAPEHAAGYFWEARLALDAYVRSRRTPIAVISEGMIEFTPDFPETDAQRHGREQALAGLDRMRTLARDGLEGWEEPCALGIAECFRGDRAQARIHLERALSLSRDTQASYALALCHYLDRRFAEAASVAKGLLLTPLDAAARDLYVRAREGEGLDEQLRGRDPSAIHEEAIAAARRLDPPGDRLAESSIRLSQAKWLDEHGRPEASDELDRAAALLDGLKEDDTGVWFQRGRVLRGRSEWLDAHGRTDEALQRAEAAVEAHGKALSLDAGFVPARVGRLSARILRAFVLMGRRSVPLSDQEVLEITDDARAAGAHGWFLEAADQLCFAELLIGAWARKPPDERLAMIDAALVEFRRQIEANHPDDPRAWAHVAEREEQRSVIAREFGRPILESLRRSEEALTRAIVLAEGRAQTWMDRGYLRIRVAETEAASGKAPDEAFREAIGDFERALTIRPGWAPANAGLASAWTAILRARSLRGEDLGDAAERVVSHFERALDQNRGDITTWMALAEFRLHQGRRLMERGQDPAGELAAADAAAEEVLSRAPSFAEARSLLGTSALIGGVYVARGGGDPEPHYARAVEHHSLAIRLVPTKALLWHERALVHFNRANHASDRGTDPMPHFRAALSDLDQANGLNPQYPDALATRCDVRTQAGHASPPGDGESLIRGALEDADRAIALDTSRPQFYRFRGVAWLNLGQELARQGKDPTPSWTSAIADLDEALSRKGDDADAWSCRGDIHYNLGSRAQEKKEPCREPYLAAASDYSKALDLRPDDMERLFWRGLAYGNAAEYDRAVADFEEVGKRSPLLREKARRYAEECKKLKGGK